MDGLLRYAEARHRPNSSPELNHQFDVYHIAQQTSSPYRVLFTNTNFPVITDHCFDSTISPFGGGKRVPRDLDSNLLSLLTKAVRSLYGDHMLDGIPGLIETWRVNVAKLTLRPASERAQKIAKDFRCTQVTIGHTKIAYWETKEVRPNHVPIYGLKILDATYQAGGALIGIARALSTSEALAPRWEWAHTFQDDASLPPEQRIKPGGPVWAWFRPGPDSPGYIDANIRWGVFGATLSRKCGPEGLFLTCPVSTNHPAAFVSWNNKPGWVDFGCGQVPPLLEVGIVRALEVMSVVDAREAIKNLWADHLCELSMKLSNVRFSTVRLFGFLGKNNLEFLRPLFNDEDKTAELVNLVGRELPAKRDAEHHFTPEEFRSLREHRGLSRSEVAVAINSLSEDFNVSKDQIANHEEGRRVTSEFLVSCLDMIYGGGGHTFRQRVPVHLEPDGLVIINFPTHWVGPVSLSISGRRGLATDGNVVLCWGDWMTSLRISSGTSVTCNKDYPNSTPLLVRLPEGWEVIAEIGYNQDAHDANKNWTFRDRPEARQSLISRLVPVYMALFGKSHDDAMKWLQKLHGPSISGTAGNLSKLNSGSPKNNPINPQ